MNWRALRSEGGLWWTVEVLERRGFLLYASDRRVEVIFERDVERHRVGLLLSGAPVVLYCPVADGTEGVAAPRLWS